MRNTFRVVYDRGRQTVPDSRSGGGEGHLSPRQLRVQVPIPTGAIPARSADTVFGGAQLPPRHERRSITSRRPYSITKS